MGLFLNDIKSHFKLDLFDKIIICLVFVIGALFSPFYCFAADNEIIVEPNVITGLSLNQEGDSFVSNPNSKVIYYSVVPGSTYRVFNTAGSDRIFLYSSEIPSEGVSHFGTFTLPAGTSEGRSDIITIPDDANYLFLSTTYYIENTWLYLIDSGMSSTISNLFSSVNGENIYQVFVDIIPYIFVVVLVCIGLLIIRRLLSSLSKGKSRI